MFKKSGKTQLNTNKLRKKNIEKKINFLLSTIKSKLRTVPINALREKVANAKQIISIFNKNFDSKIVTKVSEIKNYTKAEDYHQKYLEKNRF